MVLMIWLLMTIVGRVICNDFSEKSVFLQLTGRHLACNRHD